MVRHFQQFARMLGADGLDSSRLRVVVEPCATHSNPAWAKRLPAALTFLFATQR